MYKVKNALNSGFKRPNIQGVFFIYLSNSGYTTTHSQLTDEELLDQGIKPNTIRLSIGTENVKDLIAALDAAFEAIK